MLGEKQLAWCREHINGFARCCDETQAVLDSQKSYKALKEAAAGRKQKVVC
jgi:hypothetical protein